MVKQWVERLFAGLSATGIVFGTILFCASLTPSLLPRTWLMQGVLCGFSFAIGYLIGAVLTRLVIRHTGNRILFIGGVFLTALAVLATGPVPNQNTVSCGVCMTML